MTVHYEARRCLHFAECVRGLPDVFDVKKRPRIQPDNAEPELVAEVIRRCPSGALHYELVRGSLEQAERPTTVHLCGRTQNQPFCDHECERTGWKSS